MKNKLIRRLKACLSAEIAIEYKACLYFLSFYFLLLRSGLSGIFRPGCCTWGR